MDWLAAVAHLRQDGGYGVLVTVSAVRGHAPRAPGAKMVVAADHTWGTIGGGNVEEVAIERARELISAGATQVEQLTSRLNSHVRGRHGQQCCGGEMELLLEPLPPRPSVAIFGVGHVGFELARVLSRFEIHLHLVDSRAEQMEELRLLSLTDGPADVRAHRVLLGEDVLEQLPAGAHVVIMTHDHAEDFALCDAAVRRPDLGSVGLIGSAAKWARFRSMLTEQGHTGAAIDRITCPIGDRGITSKEPAAIAVGVAADLVRAFERSPTTQVTARRAQVAGMKTTSE
ncbi:MAG: xanthine dehydrogenase accessory protein XdhC [Ornithinimicrobium sp.]